LWSQFSIETGPRHRLIPWGCWACMKVKNHMCILHVNTVQTRAAARKLNHCHAFCRPVINAINGSVCLIAVGSSIERTECKMGLAHKSACSDSGINSVLNDAT
jgi:hypothetical protein